MLDDLLLRHPGLLATEEDGGKVLLRGTVKLQDRWYNIKMKIADFPQIGDVHLAIRLGHNEETYTMESMGPPVTLKWTAQQLIEHIPELLRAKDKVPQHGKDLLPSPKEDIYAQIVSVVAPDAYEVRTNADASIVRFERFANHESHYLELDLPTLGVREHSLPDGSVPFRDLLEKTATLPAMVQQYQKYLDDLQPFYENFIDIDELCYVVEPAAVTPKHNWRLFLYSERVFFKLTIGDAFAPLASMSLQMIGPTQEVERLRRIYGEGLKSWDVELDILKNLLRIFNVCYFPMPPGNDEERSAKEEQCNICLCYRSDDDEIPVVSCDNAKCTLLFHAVCLRRWFNTQEKSKEFLQVSFGECPFCKAKLSTSFQQLLQV